MAATKKTDNHYTADKVALRLAHLPHGDTIKVLDAFGGRGVIWKAVQRKTKTKIERTAIDERLDITEFHLHGDNLKVMRGLDLIKFDIIDLDAYGCPIEQIQIVKDSGFSGVVFVTFIQAMKGVLPKQMLIDTGFPAAITTKARSVAARRGWDIFKEWLAQKGVQRIAHRSKGRKHYLAFGINGAELSAADCNIRQGGTSASLS